MIWGKNADSQVERMKRGPFKLSFMRWYELIFIILFSLFANIVSGLRFDPSGSWMLFPAVVSLFVSAICSFNIFRIMDMTWRGVTMAAHKDPIGEFYKSFADKDEKKLWVCFLTSVGAFIAYVIFSVFA
jgi:hypothetical protein